MASPPLWFEKHPCGSCGTGYGFCLQGWSMSLKCCSECDHPGRWASDPWTADDLVEMWEGKEMPEDVRQTIKHLREAET